jgi:hypothetical protein
MAMTSFVPARTPSESLTSDPPADATASFASVTAVPASGACCAAPSAFGMRIV